MRKFKWVWVLGICAAMFLGPLGTIDLSGQEFQWRPAEVPFNRVNVEAWITWTNQILDATIRRLRDMDRNQILDNIEQLTSPFTKSYLKTPVFVQASGQEVFGWSEVIWELKNIADRFERCGGSIVEHSRSGAHGPGARHDFRFNIETELILNPHNNPGIRGCGLHRTLCYPEECQ